MKTREGGPQAPSTRAKRALSGGLDASLDTGAAGPGAAGWPAGGSPVRLWSSVWSGGPRT